MGAPFSDLRSKVSRAVAAYLIAAEAGTFADTTGDGSTLLLTLPNTRVKCVGSQPGTPFSGNRYCMLRIEVRGSAVQTGKTATSDQAQAARVAFDQRCAAVYDALMQSDDVGQSLLATASLITGEGNALAVSQDPGNPQSDALAAANADMADFTCLNWLEEGEGEGELTADEEGTLWSQVFLFKALACPSAIS